MVTVIDKDLHIDSWKITTAQEKLYSSDVVIDAYLTGKKEGLQQNQKVLIQQLESNVKKASQHTAQIVKHLKAQSINPLSAHLKLSSFDEMKVLLTLSETDFISEKITDVYDHISAFEETVSEDLYTIYFTLAIAGEQFNRSLLDADGYIFETSDLL